MLTPEILFRIIRCPGAPERIIRARCERWVPALVAGMVAHEIVTLQRQAHFIGQLAHESGRFVYTREIWGPTKAQRGYDNRADLGNTRPEAREIAARHGSTPGKFWCGHGPLQITGYDNHLACGRALGLDLVNNPRLLELAEYGSLAAAWWWQNNGLNELADTGNIDHVSDRVNRGRITRPVGDANGYGERKMLTERALQEFGLL